jgi:hypothetical protein
LGSEGGHLLDGLANGGKSRAGGLAELGRVKSDYTDLAWDIDMGGMQLVQEAAGEALGPADDGGTVAEAQLIHQSV